MCRSRSESNNGSYAGRIAPPGMPNTTSTPISSRERTSDWAPDSCVTPEPSKGELLKGKKRPLVHGTEGRARGDGSTSGHAPRDYYELSHAATVANRSKRCQAGGTTVSVTETQGDRRPYVESVRVAWVRRSRVRPAVTACVAVAAVLGIPAAGAAPVSTRTNDYVLLAVTAGDQGADGLATSIAMQVSDGGSGPRVSALGLGTSSGGAINAQEGGGGPNRLSTTSAAGGASAQLSGPVSTLAPQPYRATLTADHLAAGQSLSLLVAFGSMRFPTLHVPTYTLTGGSVSLRLVQGTGTVIGRVGDPTDGGIAADAGPLGAGVQQHDFAARTGIAGAFMMGPTQLNTSSWTAPDGNAGRWANVGSV